MSIVRVKNKYQVVIPESVREQIGVEVGDMFEATAEKGAIILKPKTVVVVDRDDYTPGERRRIDAQLAKSLAEHKHGKSCGPFTTHEEMTKFLHAETKKPRAKQPLKTTRRTIKRRAK